MAALAAVEEEAVLEDSAVAALAVVEPEEAGSRFSGTCCNKFLL